MDNLVREALDYSMQPGMGNSLAVQISRKEDGFLFYCFRCRRSGFFPDDRAGPSDVAKIVARIGNPTKADNRPEVVELPHDMSTELPPKALVYLYDRYIEPVDMGRFGIGWSPSHTRTVFPVFKYAGTPKTISVDNPENTKIIWARKLVGWAGKKLDDDTDPKKPKWHLVRQRDIKHPRFIAPPEFGITKKQVVLVEDIISAIRISQHGITGVALMTTYLPYELYPVLRGWDVKLWLDDDAYEKSCKYFAALNSNGVKATIVHTKKDPKDLRPDEIDEKLK
jgi:hypothetical protein